MSTIGSLMLALGQGGPKPYGDIMEQTTRTRQGELSNETALLKLAELKRSQATEEQFMEAIKNDPELAKLVLGGGGSMIGSLRTAPAAPGGPPPAAAPGPITQSPLGGGPSQQMPATPDASRFANVSPQGGGPIPPNVMGQTMPTVTPPQSVLGSLGPAGGMPGGPQGPMQGPQNPLLAMAAKDPRAAMMLQQQIQTQQDRQWKMQEQQLGMGVKVLGYVAQQAQGVKDQAGLDAMRTDLQSSGLGKYAAQLPQFYSKEAMEPFIARGSTAKDRAETLYHEAKAHSLDMETRMFPELIKRFRRDGEAQAPAGETAPTSTAAPTTGAQARPAPPEYESAITEANRLFPQVSTTRIKSIIAAESSYDAKAVSSKGAKGPMGLMDDTAREMGVKDSFNVQENVRGGTRYYAQLLTKYGGDERKALTAYNWGMGNFAKAGDDVTKAPPETQAYVQRVLGGGGGAATGATGTAQTAPADPRIAHLDREIARRTEESQMASLFKNESLSTRLNDEAKRLTDERTRLLAESQRQQERAEEIPRAVARKTAETEEAQRLERQRQAGPMLPKERRELLTGLRTDIRQEPTFKLYQDIRSSYQNVQIGAERDDAQGDLALISGLARILDPQGTVREGEFQTVAGAQGRLQQIMNTTQRFFEGDRLTPENRKKFLSMAHAIANEKLGAAQRELRSVYEPLAKEGNIQFGQLLPLEDLKALPTATSGLTQAQQDLINKHRTP